MRPVSNLYQQSNESHFEVYSCLPSEVYNLCLYQWHILYRYLKQIIKKLNKFFSSMFFLKSQSWMSGKSLSSKKLLYLRGK